MCRQRCDERRALEQGGAAEGLAVPLPVVNQAKLQEREVAGVNGKN